MTTTFSRSQTLASWPKCFLNTPIVPGPQTSWVMRTSTSTQMLSPGRTLSRPAARARIFSVRVIGAMWRVLSKGNLSNLYHHSTSDRFEQVVRDTTAWPDAVVQHESETNQCHPVTLPDS